MAKNQAEENNTMHCDNEGICWDDPFKLASNSQDDGGVGTEDDSKWTKSDWIWASLGAVVVLGCLCHCCINGCRHGSHAHNHHGHH